MNCKLKKARQAKRLTREELARKAGVPVVLLTLLEDGKTSVATIKDLTAVAKALDQTVEEIFLP